MTLRARRVVERLPWVAHGGIDEAELERQGLEPENLLDFSTGVNPWGPPPMVQEALKDVPIGPYPDPSAVRLRRAIGTALGVSPDEVLVGHGASELIQLVAWAYITQRRRVMIWGPTYGEYERVTRLMGARPIVYRQDVEGPGAWDRIAVERALARERPHVAFLCNPNNPTGHRLSGADIRRWTQRYPDTLFVIDESYAALAGGSDLLDGTQPIPANCVVLRSLTKDYGLAGLRLGYAVAPAPIITTLRRCQIPWSVGTMAQVAGIVVFTDPTVSVWLRQVVQNLRELGDRLRQSVQSLGFRVLAGTTPFFLIHVGDATLVRNCLLRQYRILVRDCTSFGLPAWIRVMPRLEASNARLVQALQDIRELIKDRTLQDERVLDGFPGRPKFNR
ncbi:MAG: histidinol-phosphate aminotransferase family protein [Acidobacteria bacterium]|nr:histidinol-phosphate aminotransferase family protein [Acidobacteriota bacterium]MDW7985037.1 histidinol-phosphate transaminase [Acidobacteriota bacterium]